MCGLRPQRPRSRQLGAGFEQALGDHRDDQLALWSRRQQLLEFKMADSAEHGERVAVRARASYLEGLGQWWSETGAAFKHLVECFDFLGRPVSEIGESAVLDPRSLAPGLAQQDGGVRFAVGHAGDVHADMVALITILRQVSISQLHDYRIK